MSERGPCPDADYPEVPQDDAETASARPGGSLPASAAPSARLGGQPREARGASLGACVWPVGRASLSAAGSRS